MSTTPTDKKDLKPWRLGKTKAPSFTRLEQILEARHQPWVSYSIKAKNDRMPISYSQRQLEDSIDALPDDERALALFSACVHGDLEIAKAIWERRGPFDIEYEMGAAQIFINDEPTYALTKAMHSLTNVRSRQELAELYEWMPTVGLGFMVGVGTPSGELLQACRLQVPIREVAWPASFSGDLPALQSGVVTNPELLVALDHRSKQSSYPKAFREILCWVDEATAAEFSESLDRFESLQYIRFKNLVPGQGYQYLDVEFKDVTPELLESVSHRRIEDGVVSDSLAKNEYDSLNIRAFPENPAEPRNKILLAYQASIPVQHGFDFKPGFVLCRTTVDFLQQFQMGQVEPLNLNKAQAFASDYAPIDLMMLDVEQKNGLYGETLRSSVGMYHRSGSYEYGIHDFYNAFGDKSPLQPHLQAAIPKAMLDFILNRHCEINIDANALLALHQGLGIDNTGLRVSLEVHDLQVLADAGFRFSEESKITKSTREHNGFMISHVINLGDSDVILDIEDPFMESGDAKKTPEALAASGSRYRNAMITGLWPADTEKPGSIGEALVMAGRKKKWGETIHEKSLLAMIDHAGIEVCASLAKTTPQWNFLKDHFGREAMAPYLEDAAPQTRGRILMDDLGI